jgi:DNA-binding NtrC family response regulator
VLTGRGTVEGAVDAIREGAFHFLQKPVDPPLLRATIDAALTLAPAGRELRRRRAQAASTGDIVVESAAMQGVLQLVERVATAKASVVVTGESGTGKEMVARSVHRTSGRRERPFVAINCAAIPATLMESELFGHERGAFTGADQRRIGCFEQADGGTLFLDEVGELPLELQAKFLRVLEDGKVRRLGGKQEISVDVRLVAATHRDLKELVREGLFREDLYFRINVFHIALPPLRERVEDIPALACHFLVRYARESGRRVERLSPGALKRLAGYAWPGNIRELRNCIERAVLLCDGDTIIEAQLPVEVLQQDTASALRVQLGLPLREVERSYVEATLRRQGGNKLRTAMILGIGEKTLHQKLHRWAALDADDGSTPQGDDAGGE